MPQRGKRGDNDCANSVRSLLVACHLGQLYEWNSRGGVGGRGLLMSGWVMVATYQPHARFLLGATTNIVHNSLIYTSARHLVADLNRVDGSQSLYFFKMSVYRLADLPFSFTSGSTPNRFLSSNYDVRKHISKFNTRDFFM